MLKSIAHEPIILDLIYKALCHSCQLCTHNEGCEILIYFQGILFAPQQFWITKSITLETACANVVVWNMYRILFTSTTEFVFAGNIATGVAHLNIQPRIAYCQLVTSLLMELTFTQKHIATMFTWQRNILEKKY